MKILGIVVGIALLFGACNANKSKRASSTRKVNLVYYEPDYIKDRRLNEYNQRRTNSQGIIGSGSGGSYAGYSYRQSLLKYKPDTTQVREELLMETSTDSLTTDSTSADFEW